VKAAKKGPLGIEMVDIAVKDGNGKLLPGAIPVVTISADGSYSGMDYGMTLAGIDLITSIEHKLGLGMPSARHPRPRALLTPSHAPQVDAQGSSGIPVQGGTWRSHGIDPHEFQIAATNLTATKARLLLMACLLKLGSLPAAKDPDKPTREELDAIRMAVAAYQAVFDTH
jgi:hypothetical protein